MAYTSAWRPVGDVPARRVLALTLGLTVELGWCLFAAASRLQAFADQGLGYSLTYLFAAALSVGLLVWGGLCLSFRKLVEEGRSRRYLLVLLVFALVAQAGAVVLLQAAHAAQKAPVPVAASSTPD